MASPRFASLVLVGLALGLAACSDLPPAPLPAASSGPAEVALERTGAATQASTSALGWVRAEQGGLARSGYAMAWMNDKAFMFGGVPSDGYQPVNDTLSWDGAKWASLALAESPSPRHGAAMAYDANLGQIILVGGGADPYYAIEQDVWSFDGTAWKMMTDASPMGPLFGAAMVGIKEGLLLFGGSVEGGSVTGGTWKWTGGTWQWLDVGGPSPRAGHAMAYDPDSDSVLLYGGTANDGSVLSDLWSFKSDSWKLLSDAGDPGPRSGHVMAALKGKIYLFGPTNSVVDDPEGGHGFMYDPSTDAWTAIPGLAMDTAGNSAVTTPTDILFFGGPDKDATYSTTGAAWTVLQAPTFGALYGTVAAYDHITHQVVATGQMMNGTQLKAPHGWDGSQWKPLANASTFPVASTALLATNGNDGLLMLTSDDYPADGAFFTYLWNGSKWTQEPGVQPTHRLASRVAYDGTGVMLFGGVSSLDYQQVADTWRWNGTAWEELHPAASPPAREGHGMAYDEVRHQVVLFGGRSESAVLNDTWLWDGAAKTWSMAAAPAPEQLYPRTGVTLGYDGTLKRVVLYGGTPNGEDTFGDVWTWDGAAWNPSTSASPGEQRLGSLSYDVARKASVFVGGRAEVSPLGDTWLLNGTTDGACVTGDDCSSGMCVAGQCTSCGNGTIDGGESCDGEDLGGMTCAGLGQGPGTVSCRADCSGFELSLCSCPGAASGPNPSPNPSLASCQSSVREANGCTYTSLPDGAVCEGGECVAGVCVLDPEPPKPDYTTSTGGGGDGVGSTGAGGGLTNPTGGGANTSSGSSSDGTDGKSSCSVANPGAGGSRGAVALGLAALGLGLARRRRRSA